MHPVKCADCDREARWYPVLVLSAPPWLYPNSPPARGVFGIPTCDEHRAARTAENLVTDAGYRMIANGFRRAGKVAPERSSIRIEFVPIDGDEARMFRRLRES